MDVAIAPGTPDRKADSRRTEQTVPKTVPADNVFTCWGLAVSEKQIPQIVENIETTTQGMELLEYRVVLAKQVLSQLSYTPLEIGLLEYCNFFILRGLTFNCN